MSAIKCVRPAESQDLRDAEIERHVTSESVGNAPARSIDCVQHLRRQLPSVRLADQPALVGALFRHELHYSPGEVGHIEVAGRINGELVSSSEVSQRRIVDPP